MPSFTRRCLMACLAVSALAIAYPAQADDYPSRPIRLVVGFPAGGPNDIQGRMIAQWLTQRLGQTVNVENKPGDSSNPATEEVVRAAADGYTLLLVGPANAINGSLSPDLPFNFLRDIAPVAAVIQEPYVVVVHPSVNANNAAELIALAKANPGKIKLAATGKGSSPYVSSVLFTSMAGLDVEVEQFAGGGPALKAMIDGKAQVMFEPMSASIEPVRSGKLRAIAVTSAARSPALPDVPPLAETVPGYEAVAVTGIGVPAATPRPIIDRLNREMNAAFADPAMIKRLADAGGTPLPGTPEDFGRLLAAETGKWAKVIKSAGIAH